MNWNLREVTPPTVEPLTLQQALDFLRETDADASQQALIEHVIIPAMREYAENYTRRAYVQRDLELLLDDWCSSPRYARTDSRSIIELPQPPLVSVAYVKYTDLGGVLQTIDAANYQVDTAAEPGRIAPVWGYWWPPIRAGVLNPIKIGYTAGYAVVGSPSDDLRSGIPAALRSWMHVRIKQAYDIRDGIMEAGWQTMPRDNLDGVLDSLIVRLLG